MLRCEGCPTHECVTLGGKGLGAVCPSGYDDVQRLAREAIDGPEKQIMINSHLATKLGYGTATRVEEIMIFARVSGYRKIGIAFCITLAREAAVFADILRDNGFEPQSVLCKNGALPRDILSNEDVANCKEGQGKALCNPVGQAEAMNAEGTDLNVILGLCVGHDALFSKYSAAPATYLAVKDRVTGHNPLAPIYQHESVFKRIHHAELPPQTL